MTTYACSHRLAVFPNSCIRMVYWHNMDSYVTDVSQIASKHLCTCIYLKPTEYTQPTCLILDVAIFAQYMHHSTLDIPAIWVPFAADKTKQMDHVLCTKMNVLESSYDDFCTHVSYPWAYHQDIFSIMPVLRRQSLVLRACMYTQSQEIKCQQ